MVRTRVESVVRGRMVGRSQGRTEVLVVIGVAYGRQFAGEDGEIPSKGKKLKYFERLAKRTEASFLQKSAFLVSF